MATYYVGPNGNDASDGLSWANRKLTLNGAENIPIAAADTVWVAPGVYRETLTVDVSGTAGNIITYIADVTGEHTDGIGGVVRITGSDDDLSATRNDGITIGSKNYRTFRGFAIGVVAFVAINITTGTYLVFEDCYIHETPAGFGGIYSSGASQSNITVRRCIFGPTEENAIIFSHSSDVSNCAHVVENCLFFSIGAASVYLSNIGGVTIRNCTMLGGVNGVNSGTNPAAGQTINVNNCIFTAITGAAVKSVTLGYVVENYNTFYANAADRTNVATGAQSLTRPATFEMPILLDGLLYPWNPFALSKWSQVARITGTGEPTDDLFGITRPVTAAKKSWGAIQYVPTTRTTGVKYAGSASLKLPDAGAHQMFVPSANRTTDISIQCYIEANYNGTQPQVIVKQPGQSDRTQTRTGTTSAWAEITDSFTPAASPPYFVVELRSLNTTSVGSYATYFDGFTVS